MNTTTESKTLRQRATKEIALLAGLLFLGIVVLPIIIYQVGQTVFGPYAGAGFSDFFGTLSAKIRSGDGVAWLLVMSPYIGWQGLRLMVFGWQITGEKKKSS